MKTLKKFMLTFVFTCYAGALFLRWNALQFLYRTLDEYFSGATATLLATTVLLIIISSILIKMLYRFEKIIVKLKNNETINEKERQTALTTYSKITRIIIITNVVGFFVGQAIVLIMDVTSGQIVPQWSRLVLTMIQATLVGFVAALIEMYTLSNWMAENRKLLNIYNPNELSSSGIFKTISGKIVLVSVVTLLFMGILCYCSSYELILRDKMTGNEDFMSLYLINAPLVIIGSFIPCIILILIVTNDIKTRIKETSERISSLGSNGDLRSRLAVSMKDDFGILTGNLNSFLDQLYSLVSNLSRETSIVSDAANVLSNSSSESSIALFAMKSSVQRIVKEGEQQNTLIENANNDISGLTENAKNVENQVFLQTTAIQQSSASINEMAANVNSVAEMASKAENLAGELRTSSDAGTDSINSAVRAINEIKSASKEVQLIIQSIQKIASQTNLLSMNAAIEAAHAGDAGAGFAVVANEVGSLAASSAKSAKDIQQHIKDMVSKIDNGVTSINAAGNAFGEISNSIEKTSNLIDTISNAMEEQRTGAGETLRATTTVVDAINMIKDLSQKQREFTENMQKSMAMIVNSSTQITSALSENKANSDSLGDAISKLGSCVSDNTEAVRRMKEQIEVFKL